MSEKSCCNCKYGKQEWNDFFEDIIEYCTVNLGDNKLLVNSNPCDLWECWK